MFEWTQTYKYVNKDTYLVSILQMVIVHLLYSLEINDSLHLSLMFVCSRKYQKHWLFWQIRGWSFFPAQLCWGDRNFRLTSIVGERSTILVEHKPPFLPGFDLATHFNQESPTGFICDGQMETSIWTVSCCLDVAMKIKVVFPDREVASQQSGLWKKHKRDINRDINNTSVTSLCFKKYQHGENWIKIKQISALLPEISVSPWASPLSLQVSVSCSSPPADVSPAPLFFFSLPQAPACASPSHAPADDTFMSSCHPHKTQTSTMGFVRVVTLPDVRAVSACLPGPHEVIAPSPLSSSCSTYWH